MSFRRDSCATGQGESPVCRYLGGSRNLFQGHGPECGGDEQNRAAGSRSSRDPGFLDRMYVRPALWIRHSCTLCPGERAEFYPALHGASGRKVCVRRGGDHGELRGASGHGKRCPVKEKPRTGVAGSGRVAVSPGSLWYADDMKARGSFVQLLSSNPAEEGSLPRATF